MTKQDEDREAFEMAARARSIGWESRNPFELDGDKYLNTDTQNAFSVWQASRDHYAPKLTERAVHAALSKSISLSATRLAIDSLRAAGLRFTEDV